MSKKLYYVQTEECIEGTGHESPLDALVEYINFSEVTEDRINEILEGRSEINYVVQYTKEELAAMQEV